jgi:Zn-dependent peptidase ImmA (M78 family)
MAKPRNLVPIEKQREIEAIIDQILLKAGLSYPENSLTDIIERSIPGVKIVEDDFNGNPNIGGMIFRKSDKFDEDLIAIQKRQSDGAKSFALAHEFAHYILGHDGEERYLIESATFNGSSIMQEEAEANFFAAALLMPRDKFKTLDVPFFTDEQLAKRFGVTVPAVRVRRNWIDSNEC